VRSAGVVLDGETVEERLEFGDCGGLAGLSCQPLFEGLVEAFDFPAGLWVVGAGVVEPDAVGVAGEFEGDAAAAAGEAGEHRPVVRQQPLGMAVVSCGVGEGGVDVAGGEHPPCSGSHAEPGVVVDDVEDLDLALVGER
jgi:hypothetical protein